MEELKNTQYLADDGVAFVEVGAADDFVGVAAGVEGGPGSLFEPKDCWYFFLCHSQYYSTLQLLILSGSFRRNHDGR